MLAPTGTRPPVNAVEKAWLETRMAWLVRSFGADAMLRAEVVRPSADLKRFERRDGTADPEAVFAFCLARMGVPATAVGFEVLDDEDPTLGGAAHWDATEETLAEEGRPVVRVGAALAAEPPRLFAACLHELAHQRLLGGGLLAEDDADHEPLTDLLPLFLGAGVVMANATVVETEVWFGNTGTRTWSKLGYLNSRQLGYALALFAHARAESGADWRRELRLDAKAAFDTGLRYLTEAGPRLFDVRRPDLPAWPTVDALVADLRGPRADLRVAAAWECARRDVADGRAVRALTEHLDEPDEAAASEIARCLASVGRRDPNVARVFVDRLRGARGHVANAALDAVAALKPPWDSVRDELTSRAFGTDPSAGPAARAMAAYGMEAAGSAQRLVGVLRRCALAGDDARVAALSALFAAVHDDPSAAAVAAFGDDEVVLAIVLDALGVDTDPFEEDAEDA
jgi:hypothetical protein